MHKLVVCLVDLLVIWLAKWLANRLTGLIIIWIADWLTEWLAGCITDWFYLIGIVWTTSFQASQMGCLVVKRLLVSLCHWLDACLFIIYMTG